MSNLPSEAKEIMDTRAAVVRCVADFLADNGLCNDLLDRTILEQDAERLLSRLARLDPPLVIVRKDRVQKW